jgi:hypothetical protein
MIVSAAAVLALTALGGYGMRLVFLFKIYREGGPEHLLIVTRGWHASRWGRPGDVLRDHHQCAAAPDRFQMPARAPRRCSMPGRRPTPEQEAAVAAFRRGDDLVLQAGAGTGKTTTLTMLGNATRWQGRYIAFNKAIAAEADLSAGRRGIARRGP